MAYMKSDRLRQMMFGRGATEEEVGEGAEVFMPLFAAIERHQILLQESNPPRGEVRKAEKEIQEQLDSLGIITFRGVKNPQYMQLFIDFAYGSSDKSYCELENLKRQRRELDQNEDTPNDEGTVTD